MFSNLELHFKTKTCINMVTNVVLCLLNIQNYKWREEINKQKVTLRLFNFHAWAENVAGFNYTIIFINYLAIVQQGITVCFQVSIPWIHKICQCVLHCPDMKFFHDFTACSVRGFETAKLWLLNAAGRKRGYINICALFLSHLFTYCFLQSTLIERNDYLF